MKKTLVVLLTVLVVLSVFAFTVSAEESAPAVSDASVESSDGNDEMGVDMEFYGFGNDGFLRNIKYMGLGMLGIFVVVGVVMIVTNVLNSVTSTKK